MSATPPAQFRQKIQRRPPTGGTPPAPPTPTPTLEMHIKNLETQLTELTARVRQAQQLAGLGTAAAMIAHEVNNMLTPMRSWAQAALDSGDPDLQNKALTVAVKNAQMLGAMADRVLTIGAAKAPTREVVSIRPAAEDAAASLCRDLSKDGIVFHIDADESVAAWADPLQVRQILFNLLLNARNAMAPRRRGRLTVSARRQQELVITTVEDNGPGMDPETLAHIFDPLWTSKFANCDKPKRCAGLGLALCRDLAEENGGTIEATSEPGVGTAFTITLPAAEPK